MLAQRIRVSSCPASCRTHWQGMASGLSHQTLRKIGEQGLMCMVEKEEAVRWRTEVILGWETNHPCVLSSKGSLGGRTFSPGTKTVPATLGSQLMDSSVQGTPTPFSPLPSWNKPTRQLSCSRGRKIPLKSADKSCLNRKC